MALIFGDAEKGRIASRVVIAGDPERVDALARTLEDPKLVTSKRGFFTYTGRYKGEDITIATHGIGAPSVAIVIEELAMLGAKVFVRFGTAGTFNPEVELGDFIMPNSASHQSGGIYKLYFTGKETKPSPDRELLKALKRSFKRNGLRFHTGKVFSTDAFYAEDENFLQKHSEKKEIAVDMECAMLFRLSSMKGLRSAAVLAVSDSLAAKKWISNEELSSKIWEGSKALFEALSGYKI